MSIITLTQVVVKHLPLRDPVAAADEVKGELQLQGAGIDHIDVAGGMATHPAHRALPLPE
ncbi:hypothetical protein ACQE3D_24595 (plasmid) [Methylomonas sp. MS20]|uniref:hypothetical protein n=1 Tax=Methylomonas sp. MS20 TaxID=3418769 RepID=UPI003D058F33